MPEDTTTYQSDGLITEEDCLSKVLIPGMIIWRPVIFLCDEIKLAPVKFIIGNRESSYIAKVRLIPGTNIYEPEVLPYYDSASEVITENPGMVIIVKSIPNPDWTHLVVSRASESLNSPGWSNKGGALFCDIPKPYNLADYFMFRSEMAAEVANLNRDEEPWEYRLEQVERIWPSEQRRDAVRLIVSNTCVNDDGIRSYKYCHIHDDNDSD